MLGFTITSRSKRMSPLHRPCQLHPSRARWAVACITLAAVALRAAALRFPPALTDEAFTFWRVCGSMGELLDTLRDDSFVPLHYQAVWLCTKLLGPDVWAMRLPSAIAGAVMPFAVYRIGRLVTGRRGGLFAATLAASSAFLGVYARNAKMYSTAWTLMALALGSMLFAVRARPGRSRRLAWLTFVLFGVAATGSHAIVCIPLATCPLIAIAWSRRRVVRNTLLVAAGTAVVMTAPLIYYTAINTWFHRAGGLSNRTEDGPAPRDNGLMWIAGWQAGRSPANLTLECASAYVGGLEWPADGDTLDGRRAVVLQYATAGAMIAIAAFTLIALFTGRTRVANLALVLLLVVLPVYAFYLRSFRTLSAPWQLGGLAWAAFAASAVAALLSHRERRRRLHAVVGWAVSVTVALTLAWLLARYAYTHAPLERGGEPRWNPLWMPRYTGFIAPLLCVYTGCVIAAVRVAVVRWIGVAGLVGLNLFVVGMNMREHTEFPWPRLCDDLVTASAGQSTVVAMDWVNVPGQRFASQLPGPYYALVRAAQLDIAPTGFRDGQTWPYRAGTQVRDLLARLHYSPVRLLGWLSNGKAVRRIVVWRSSSDGIFSEMQLAGWHTVERENFAIWQVWTWQTFSTCERSVLERDNTSKDR